ncbi:hypothetical protein DVS28_b0090 (plasmid) [Euzebya pacifica]|uniref:Uncharacterized protein n=1 Tax=Euzebya pacifica TaxID=1608957 RepID=A0A346Y5W3_9ACTN|nr:hypothetical protein [Euzebya pacifica]AXV09860.1 hypothetical protein DVS28_b0090 [Euzebya pacifica]
MKILYVTDRNRELAAIHVCDEETGADRLTIVHGMSDGDAIATGITAPTFRDGRDARWVVSDRDVTVVDLLDETGAIEPEVALRHILDSTPDPDIR